MADINSCNFTGRLTADPVAEQTKGGSAVLRFSIAVNGGRRDQQTGKWIEEASYVDLVVYGLRAERYEKRLAKGTPVAVDCELRQSRWQAEDGTRRSRYEFVVDSLHDFGGKSQGSEDVE